MEKVLDNLKKREIIYTKSIQLLKNYIATKHPEASDQYRAQVFADAIHKIVDDHIKEFSRKNQRAIKHKLFSEAAHKNSFEVNAYDIMRTCVSLDIEEDTFIDDLTSWINRQQDVPVYREELRQITEAVREEIIETALILQASQEARALEQAQRALAEKEALDKEEAARKVAAANAEAMKVLDEIALLKKLEEAFEYQPHFDGIEPELYSQGKINEAYEDELRKDQLEAFRLQSESEPEEVELQKASDLEAEEDIAAYEKIEAEDDPPKEAADEDRLLNLMDVEALVHKTRGNKKGNFNMFNLADVLYHDEAPEDMAAVNEDKAYEDLSDYSDETFDSATGNSGEAYEDDFFEAAYREDEDDLEEDGLGLDAFQDLETPRVGEDEERPVYKVSMERQVDLMDSLPTKPKTPIKLSKIDWLKDNITKKGIILSGVFTVAFVLVVVLLILLVNMFIKAPDPIDEEDPNPETYNMEVNYYDTMIESHKTLAAQKVHVLPEVIQHKAIDEAALKRFFESRSVLVGESPYFEIILEVSNHYGLNPLLMFAITGQEQGFVPKTHERALEIINNPYNVYVSWQLYNTDLEDSASIAAVTIINQMKTLPEGEDPIYWLNQRYAEDQGWHKGVKNILETLEAIAGL